MYVNTAHWKKWSVTSLGAVQGWGEELWEIEKLELGSCLIALCIHEDYFRFQ